MYVRANQRSLVLTVRRCSLTSRVIRLQAYVTDEGYDLDLLFEVDGYRGHIYSDVEGSQMTNYLFVDDQLLAQNTIKDCISKHKPGNKS